MAINGLSGTSSYDYQSSLISNASRYQTAAYEAEETVKNLTSSTAGSTTTKSTATFLMGYQSTLEDLEAASSKLQLSQEDNILTKYENAKAEAAKAQEALEKAGEEPSEEVQAAAAQTAAAVEQLENEIVSAVKDFAEKYNDTMSYLSSNSSRSAAVASHQSGFQRAMLHEKSLNALGLSFDKDGDLQLDEETLRKAIGEDFDQVKDLLGGQFGMAERVGEKASAVLDTSVDRIVGASTSSTESSSSGSLSSAASSGSMSDSFRYFAQFAKTGNNLSNYYAVSMLNMLV